MISDFYKETTYFTVKEINLLLENAKMNYEKNKAVVIGLYVQNLPIYRVVNIDNKVNSLSI